MKNSAVRSFKGQMKIQQMALVLVGFVIFFALVAVFFTSFNLSSLGKRAEIVRQEQAQQRVSSLTGLPELIWTQDSCASCIDLDKALALKNSSMASLLWEDNIAFVQIKQIYPIASERECSPETYLSCSRITLYRTSATYTTEDSFVSLCRHTASGKRCMLGKLLVGAVSS